MITYIMPPSRFNLALAALCVLRFIVLATILQFIALAAIGSNASEQESSENDISDDSIALHLITSSHESHGLSAENTSIQAWKRRKYLMLDAVDELAWSDDKLRAEHRRHLQMKISTADWQYLTDCVHNCIALVREDPSIGHLVVSQDGAKGILAKEVEPSINLHRSSYGSVSFEFGSESGRLVFSMNSKAGRKAIEMVRYVDEVQSKRAFHEERKNVIHPSDSAEPNAVSIQRLLENPQEWDDTRVVVEGYFSGWPEVGDITETRFHADEDERRIRVTGPFLAAEPLRATSRLDSVKVRLEGLFAAPTDGGPPVISRVTKLESLE